ncbi:MAG UNVERIFIED_CONTAM: hypothetical protein LVR18_23820 [Planctomycetaceae bacterium]
MSTPAFTTSKFAAEADGEYIYGARNNSKEGIKFNAETGAIALKLTYPEESGLGLKDFKPTAITVAPTATSTSPTATPATTSLFTTPRENTSNTSDKKAMT